MLLFFIQQKTAYEMRISDWSSDVCSSDLHDRRPTQPEIIRNDYLAEPHTVISGPRNRYEGIRSSGALRRRRIDIPPKLYRAQQTRDRFADRSEERRVGKESVSTFRTRWSP